MSKGKSAEKKRSAHGFPMAAEQPSHKLAQASGQKVAAQHQQKIKGIFESIPANRTGVWKIGGHLITAQTQFDDDECPIKVEGMGEARGAYQGQTFIATKIECEEAESDDKDEGKNERGDEDQENGQEDGD